MFTEHKVFYLILVELHQLLSLYERLVDVYRT